jgi:GNAT superfamily N-acetyltransferase
MANRNLSPDQFSYEPRSWSSVSFVRGPNDEPITSKYRVTNPDTGFEFAHHEVAAVHPEHGVVGKAHWSDMLGNMDIEVDPRFRRQGIGMRLVDEAHKYDPKNALRGLTPVSHEGLALTQKVQKKYGLEQG